MTLSPATGQDLSLQHQIFRLQVGGDFLRFLTRLGHSESAKFDSINKRLANSALIRIEHSLGCRNVGLIQQRVWDMLLDVQISPLISRRSGGQNLKCKREADYRHVVIITANQSQYKETLIPPSRVIHDLCFDHIVAVWGESVVTSRGAKQLNWQPRTRVADCIITQVVICVLFQSIGRLSDQWSEKWPWSQVRGNCANLLRQLYLRI